MTNPAPEGRDAAAPVEGTPPAATPPPPAYESSELLEPTPAFDSLAQEQGLGGTGLTEPIAPISPIEDRTTLGPDADYALAPNPADGGPLGTVKAFAAKNPAAFIGAALAVGWLVGKLLPSGNKDDD
jgi:hypothetical protein